MAFLLQVTRMLPGGLDVIGLFVVAPAQMLKDSQAKLRQMMFAVQKAVTKNMPVFPADSIVDRILLQNAIAPFCKDIWKSVALIDGEMRNPSDLLAAFPDSKKGKGRERESPTQERFSVDFLLSLNGSEDIPDPKVNEVKELVSVRGITVCRAFVNWKATVKEALEAIKSDVVRSLCARCELLSEDIELMDEMSESGQIFDTPVRVFSPFGSGGAELCDYMFQDEKVEEILDRIKELTDVRVRAETLEMDCERPASGVYRDMIKLSKLQYA
nr:hypothetical protein BaRGS_032370 [Batillaria attramentaria]